MRAEASALLRGLQGREKTMKVRLGDVLKRLQRDSDEGLLSELASIRNDLAMVRRSLARATITEQPIMKLKNELHDWLRHAEMSGGEEHELREERLEMLGSELRLRGVDVPEGVGKRVTHNAYRQSEAVVPAAIEQETLQDSIVESMIEEEQEPTDWTAAGEYWDQLVAGLGASHHDSAQLTRLLKAFRDVQGERKREDREAGIRRYRLTAFEGWN